MSQSKELILYLFSILIICKANKDNPLDYLKDAFSIDRPFSVSKNENKDVSFHCKPAQGEEFEKCFFKTPFNKTYQAQKNGIVYDIETHELVSGVNSFFELNGQTVCGLQISNFVTENFGWWSCNLTNSGPNHIGTFKINQPGEWPTDIRLKNEFEVMEIHSVF